MRKIVSIEFVLATLILIILSNSAAADLVIIVNETNLTSLNKRQIANIYLDKTNEFPNGATAVPIAQPEDTLANIAFQKRFLKMNKNQLKRYWAKRSFSGRAKQPKALKNDAEVTKFVNNNSSAIGYVDRASTVGKSGIRIVAFGD